MKVTFFPDNGTITGRPETIIDLMRTAKDIRDGVEPKPFTPDAVNEYVDYLIEFYNQKGIRLIVNGTTHSDRSESVLREMQKHKLLYIYEEDFICQ